ncbi:Glycosyltransferase involved in cell wall bisynthesis [Aquiflexum balticum DSM 16537]|uniref:Glycosyltransferase involved in cell wall bisynthesis n=1 Tax=Aquiflexum balticum DSM 16537 TaxID=758820 RepID=A0A1W2HB71_9BACT|nr:glycosyltransferase family A protein [Aquiflexum balticum]SMD46054.1 Glycosyltransferase involved in cell wall bisynthesis [Aquiflexum balticum DSM 16537]
MFSVIIPLFNKSKYIKRAIDSVLEQKFQEFEIIVINDGSTDGGENEVLRYFANKVKLLSQPNRGVSSARNEGIKNATFDYLAFLDADDYWHPDYLSAVRQVLIENPTVGIIGTKYDSIKLEDGKSIKYHHLTNYFKIAPINIMFFTSGTVLKKEFFDKNPGFDERLKLGEDVDVWLRSSLYYGDGIYISNKLVFYGQDDSQRATQKQYLIEETVFSKLIEENYFENSAESSKVSKKDFNKFISKYLYFNLFNFYTLKENIQRINRILIQIPNNFFLMSFPYKFPDSVLKKIFDSDWIKFHFRNYLKFCVRYIYKN